MWGSAPQLVVHTIVVVPETTVIFIVTGEESTRVPMHLNESAKTA